RTPFLGATPGERPPTSAPVCTRADPGPRGHLPHGVSVPSHDRMPVVIEPGDFAAWLDRHTPAADLHALLRPYPAEDMTAVPERRYVSNPRNEGPLCLAS